MYSAHQPVSAAMNGGGIASSMMDGSGTINPAALNSTVLSGATPAIAPQPSPRGQKRSRSPEGYGDGQGYGDDDDKPRKRGRPPKNIKIGESPTPTNQQLPQLGQSSGAAPVRTPQLKAQPLPQTLPAHASPPPKSTPTKGTVLKALPTVRDHTTDQLNPEGDEYIPREYDDAGEKKVGGSGQPLDGRVYRCKTFLVPNRGDKLFMLATECARVLGYRDSYLLFNKNRSLYKIIATQAEKDDLIHQDVLPYSYRSRQIAIVTARSMFRQFGSRLIVNGRRVRDDYWESKARKQGFTEEDAAGEKRPGAAKQREAAQAEANAAHLNLTGLPHGQVIYDQTVGRPPSLADYQQQYHQLMNPAMSPSSTEAPVTLPSNPTRDYSGIQRPRQEITGPPYQDKLTTSTPTELLSQTAQAAEYNKSLGQQRHQRAQYMDDYWKRPQEVPEVPQQPAPVETDAATTAVQHTQSPRLPAARSIGSAGQPSMAPRQHAPPHIMNTPAYGQQPHRANPMPSPMHGMQQPLRPDQMHHRSPSVGMGPGAQSNAYGYQQNQMWSQQPQPSPLAQQHSIGQYGQQSQQQSPHLQQSQVHQSPQMHHAQNSTQLHNPSMGYQQMGSGMPGNQFPPMARNPYQAGANPQQFMQQSSAGQQGGMQGWAPQQSTGQQAWQGGY